jgi:hypothetical protein
MSPLDIIDQLERTRNETLPLFDLGTDALRGTYGPGKWSVRIILQHLADAECVYGYRIKRVISEPRQVVWATDQDAWSRRLDYGGGRLDTAKRLFEATRAANVDLAERYYAGSEEIVCCAICSSES